MRVTVRGAFAALVRTCSEHAAAGTRARAQLARLSAPSTHQIMPRVARRAGSGRALESLRSHRRRRLGSLGPVVAGRFPPRLLAAADAHRYA